MQGCCLDFRVYYFEYEVFFTIRVLVRGPKDETPDEIISKKFVRGVFATAVEGKESPARFCHQRRLLGRERHQQTRRMESTTTPKIEEQQQYLSANADAELVSCHQRYPAEDTYLVFQLLHALVGMLSKSAAFLHDPAREYSSTAAPRSAKAWKLTGTISLHAPAERR